MSNQSPTPCDDFEAAWQSFLDGDALPAPAGRAEFERHLAECARCSATQARFELLLAAIRPDSAEAPVCHQHSVPLSRSSRVLLAAAAVAVAALSWTMVRSITPERRVQAVGHPAAAAVVAGPDLGSSVRNASSATLDLARAASAPAARLGRDLLVHTPFLRSNDLVPNVANPTETWREIADRVNGGLLPLSRNAIRALELFRPLWVNPAASPEASRRGV